MPVADLKPHPKHVAIYGNDDVAKIRKSIRRDGVIHNPLLITKSKIIIDGWRRWQGSSLEVKKTVPCIYIDDGLTEEDEIALMLTCNEQRVKTNVQIVKEAEQWLVIEAPKSERRKLRGKKADPVATLSEGSKGRTREIVAKKCGSGCGTNLEKGFKVMRLVRKLDSTGQAITAEGLRRCLNESFETGFRAMGSYERDTKEWKAILDSIGSDKTHKLTLKKAIASRMTGSPLFGVGEPGAGRHRRRTVLPG